jgi:Zn-dependent M28 family amino/carboxypeptidase
MSDQINGRDQSLEATKKTSADNADKMLNNISNEDRANLVKTAGKDAADSAALPALSINEARPLKVIEVPADAELDNKDWVRPLEYKKGVPGEFLPTVSPHAAPDARVSQALSRISEADITEQLQQLSGEKEVIVNGRPVKIESRSTHGQSYNDALQFYKDKYEKDGFKVVLDTYTKNGETLHNLRAIKQGLTKPNEVVMYGAHIDSTAGFVWGDESQAPGADDDGSGAAALSQIGHAIKDLPLDRTVVISLFSGEEQGLWGSRAMSELYRQSQDQVAGDLSRTGVTNAGSSKIVGMYQLDMIGYAPDSNTVESHDTASQEAPHALTDMLNSKVQQYGLNLQVYGAHNDEMNNRSDHYNFARMGVPAIFLSEPYDTAKNPNPHYHSTHDVVSNLNIPFISNVAKAAAAAGVELAGLRPAQVGKDSVKGAAVQMMPLESRIVFSR